MKLILKIRDCFNETVWCEFLGTKDENVIVQHWGQPYEVKTDQILDEIIAPDEDDFKPAA